MPESRLLDKTRVTWLVAGVFLGIIVGVGGVTLSRQIQPAPIVITPPAPTATPQPTATPGPILVFVNGQVARPAVYELPPGSRVEAAITAAGGFTEEANTAVVNLAQPLNDGAQVYVPGAEENWPAAGVVVNPAAGAAARSPGNGAVGLININTATIEELDALPGIGPSIAQKIVEYRESNGPFATIESIMDVPGIGEAKFAQIREQITVGE